MGFLTWETFSGKIMVIILFLVALLALIFIIDRMVPGIQLLSRMVEIRGPSLE